MIGALFLAVSIQTVLAQENSGTSSWDKPLDLCWSVSLPDLSSIPVASDNAITLIIPGTPAKLIALTADTGRRLWSAEVGGRIVSPPIVTSGSVDLVTLSDTSKGVEARRITVDLRSGLSTAGPPAPFSKGTRVLAAGGEFAAISADGWITPLSGSPGGVMISSGLGSIEGASTSGRWAFAWNSEGRVTRFLLEKDGTIRLSSVFTVTEGVSGAFLVDGRYLYAGTGSGFVEGLDVDSGHVIWRSRTGGSIDHIEKIGDELLAFSRDNFVYRLSSDDGGRIWKRKLAGRITGSASLDDEHMAFVSLGSSEIAILRTDDGRLVNSQAVENAGYFVSPPVLVSGLLIAVHDKGISAFARKSTCGKN